jgi:superoxide reductase
MTEKLQVYKCDVCGNIVELLHEGAGELVCCGQPMKLFEANTVDAAKEKHVPVKEAGANGLTVKVGSVPHPMEEKHYIEWVEITQDGKAYRQFLKPGEAPQAVFPVQGEWTAREYCNLHGLWKA